MSADNPPVNGTRWRLDRLDADVREERALRREEIRRLDDEKADKTDVTRLASEMTGLKHALYAFAAALIVAGAGFSVWALQLASTP